MVFNIIRAAKWHTKSLQKFNHAKGVSFLMALFSLFDWINTSKKRTI